MEGNLGSSDTPYGYEETLMHGRFTSNLSEFAHDYAKKLKYQIEEEQQRDRDEEEFRSYSGGSTFSWQIKYYWRRFLTVLANDYSFLFILGVLMALISFMLDYFIEKCQMAQILLYQMVKFSALLQYVLWIGFPLLLITFSVGFVHLVSPHAIGSGIPEMKVILRGTVLRRYLSFPTFISKTVGLISALGSGIPIGKEGPFVHISSMVARMLSKFIKAFHGIYVNESRNTDMLACACAVGVSSSFAAPIGGVLFSIEVTSMYFAVRNYWRGFFAAVCGAFMFRLLAVLDSSEETITALFKTRFRIDFPFDVQEFVAFGFIGLTCGLAGALFVYTHRKIVDFHQHHKQNRLNRFLEKSRFIYPAMIVLIVSTLSFPKGSGQFVAGQLTAKEALYELFSNTTWSAQDPSPASMEVLRHWQTAYTSIYVTLTVFVISKFILTAVCVALPVPAGVFFPVFIIGAAYGRLVGECMATWFPNGVNTPIVPGGYAVVGAAAMAAAVTHTISTSVIVFELTGQITHILPVMIAVLIANAVVQQLQPSIYDSIIEIKKLPYLPDISRPGYIINVGDIMDTRLFYITTKSSYLHLKNLLRRSNLLSFAVVDKPDSMMLLGSIRRIHLENLLARQLSKGHKQDGGLEPIRELSRVSYRPGSDAIDVVFEEKQGGDTKVSKKSKVSKSSAVTTLQKLFTHTSTELSEAATSSGEFGADAYCPAWEMELLHEEIDFSSTQIDPAPFQLVEQTSLYKAHKLFCLLNLSQAYVTLLGRLIGVVTLQELRLAIQNENFFLERRKLRRQKSFQVPHVDSETENPSQDSPRLPSESEP
ncbi:chloride channel protein 2-like isoform X2 [Rhopilema esculentum]|uniref:chloride channel protein 2-like isoform X2 n=1 Tax=Rhopilema esculentum TaxID=499914 RepID=UPI0031DF7EE7